MIQRDKMMERTRAAVCYANATRREDIALAGFMAIFHPEVSQDKVREMVWDKRKQMMYGR